MTAFHVTAKPTGSICNLDCAYCFFLSKQLLYPKSRLPMSEPLAEAYIRQLFEGHGSGEVVIMWQGGEPTLAGIEFFERAVACVEKYRRADQTPLHCIQTNAVLVDRNWARFFKRHEFLVGVSIDGPRALHDAFRVDKQAAPTFDRVMRGLEALQSAGVEWNALTTLHSANAGFPREVYRFLTDGLGARFIQFIPVVERSSERPAGDASQSAATVRTGAGDARPFYSQHGDRASARSITPEAYGRFLVEVFDEWFPRDIRQVSVQAFDAALAAWCGLPAPLCVFAATCGPAVALEHNGDVYSCDHYVEPGYRIGNIGQATLRSLVDGQAQRQFGNAKRDTLPAECRACEFLFACHGGCPKDRFVSSPGEKHPRNYLCPGYKAFFRHVDLPMRSLRRLLEEEARIMQP